MRRERSTGAASLRKCLRKWTSCGRLEALVFPFIGQRIREEIAKARADGAVRFLVLDAAVMMEAGWDKNCNKVIFVDAPPEVREQRLRSKRGWSAQEVRERARSQLDVDVKRRRADGVIDNSGAPAKLPTKSKNCYGNGESCEGGSDHAGSKRSS